MAMPGALEYFNSFPADQQEKMRQAWGGMGRLDEWFRNALKAGDPGAVRARAEAEAAGGKRSEDFKRKEFDDETLRRWQPYYDQATGKYKSMRGAEGLFEKPTECPPGQMPSGPDETDPCISNEEAQGRVGPKAQVDSGQNGVIQADPGANTDYFQQSGDLQSALMQKFASRSGLFGWGGGRNSAVANALPIFGKGLTGGGVWWGDTKNMFDSALGGGGKAKGGGGGAGAEAGTLGGAVNLNPHPIDAPDVTGGNGGDKPIPIPGDMQSLSGPLFGKYRSNPWWRYSSF